MSKNHDLLTLGQASRMAACSRDTLRRAAQREELFAEMRPGKKGLQWYVKQADLLDWLQARGKTVTHSPSADAQQQRIQELESQVAEYARQARQAQQELEQVKQELLKARQLAGEATRQVQVARGLVSSWTEPRLFGSLRKILRV